jgi:hypothetical protein
LGESSQDSFIDRQLVLTRMTLSGIEVLDVGSDDSYFIGWEDLPVFCMDMRISDKYKKVFEELTGYKKVMVYNGKVYKITEKQTVASPFNYHEIFTRKLDGKGMVSTLDNMYYEELAEEKKIIQTGQNKGEMR